MDIKSIDLIKNRSWEFSDINFYKKDDVENAVIIYKDKKTRLRAGMIVIRNNSEILLGEDENEPGVFSLPGGSIESNETIEEAAVRETKEEVEIEVTDVKDTGIDYCECHTEVLPWVKENIPENDQWYNYYTCLIIGNYNGKYEGHVNKADKDSAMKKSSKFYKIIDVIKDKSFKLAWKEALYKFGIIKNTKGILTEATRNQLITKSKRGEKYKNSDGNRWTEKNKCKVANMIKDYNKIDMNTFWKDDRLIFGVKVQGETDTYLVTVEFSKVLDRIKDRIIKNKNKLEIKCIYNALLEALNSSDVKIDCSCPDFIYRFKVWATKNNYNTGKTETREAKITNPSDNLGAACKHILCVLNNAEWLQKISSVINNYINYCKDNLEYNYGKFIFPKLYGMTYNKAIQMSLEDYDDNGNIKNTLQSDETIINLSNAIGKMRGRIKKGSNKNPIAQANRQNKK